MLSRDCDGCPMLHDCSKRYRSVRLGEKVYCSDGTAHLVDQIPVPRNVDYYEKYIECFH